MDNQHQMIKGYRDLTQEEINTMNEIKKKGEEIRALCDKVKLIPQVDQRAAALAVTNLQQGFMWLTRSVARPESF